MQEVYITDSYEVESDASLGDSREKSMGEAGCPACLTEVAWQL
jgi:hypothetical protein